MRTFWLCATLLPLFLFSCALPEKQCQGEDNDPQIRRVAVHSNVSVPCPSFTAVEMKFMLHKGKNKVASIMYRNVSLEGEVVTDLKNTVKHSVNINDNTTHFVLYNVTMDLTGLYKCRSEKSFPPPLENIKEEPQTIVIVEDQQPKNCQKMDTSANVLPVWVGFGVLSIYGLIITCTALTLKFRLKRECMATHDYMNMKPRTRRKKQGIHHPTHLSWYNDTSNGKTVSKKLPS